MSASDKKRQRKAALAEGLTQKQKLEQAQAAAAKRNRMLYTGIGVICAVAAVGLLIWNSMGSWQTRIHMRSNAVTINGESYTAADVQYYYGNIRNQYAQLADSYASSGISMGYTGSVADGAQWYNEEEGTTYADYFRESALDNLKQTAALCAAAKAEGYTLSAEGQKSIDDALAQIDLICLRYNLTCANYFTQQYGAGVTEKVFLRNLTNTTLAGEFSQKHQNDLTYDDAALMEYYSSHPDTLDSYDYRTFFISGAAADPTDADGNPLKDADGNTVTATEEERTAAMAEAKAKADEAVAALDAADDPDVAFVAIAPEYVAESQKDAYSSPEYSLREGVLGNTLNQNNSAIASWLMDSAREKGDATAIEVAGSGYHVILFKDRYLQKDNSVNIRHILILADTAGSTETDANGQPIPTQEALDAAKTEAQTLMDQWKAGDKTAESFGALAEEHSDDPGSNKNGGRYAYVYQGDMFPAFDEWIFDASRQSGDVDLVENPQSGQYGWHVVYFEGTDDYWEGQAIKAKRSTDQSEWLTSITDALDVKTADAMKYVGSPNTATPTESATPSDSQSAE